jgi:hypothetical protein
MRFGVALSMWESLVDSEYDEDAHPDYEARPVSQPSRPQPRDSAPEASRARVAPLRQEPAQTGRIAAGQQQAIIRMCEELGYTTEDRIAADFNKGSLSMLTQEEAGKLIGALDQELRVHRAAIRQQKELVTAGGVAGADAYTR